MPGGSESAELVCLRGLEVRKPLASISSGSLFGLLMQFANRGHAQMASFRLGTPPVTVWRLRGPIWFHRIDEWRRIFFRLRPLSFEIRRRRGRHPAFPPPRSINGRPAGGRGGGPRAPSERERPRALPLELRRGRLPL